MNEYGALALCYDRLMDFDYSSLCDYYESEFAAWGGGKPSSVLDLACGTGAVSLELSKRGYDLVSVDLSEQMLSVAQKRIPKSRGVLLLHQDMRKLDLNDTVDCAVCALDAINHLSGAEQVRQVFERVHLFLNPGGLFLFDVHSEENFFSTLANGNFIYDLDDTFCIWQSLLDRQRLKHHLDIFIREPGSQLFRRYEDDFCEYWYSRRTLCSALESCGFSVKNVNSLDPSRIYFTAKKEL